METCGVLNQWLDSLVMAGFKRMVLIKCISDHQVWQWVAGVFAMTAIGGDRTVVRRWITCKSLSVRPVFDIFERSFLGDLLFNIGCQLSFSVPSRAAHDDVSHDRAVYSLIYEDGEKFPNLLGYLADCIFILIKDTDSLEAFKYNAESQVRSWNVYSSHASQWWHHEVNHVVNYVCD